MAGNNNRDEADALPFLNVTDYDMFSLQSSQRTELIEKFENNGFIEYFRRHRTDIPDCINSSHRKQYFDIDEFNSVFVDLKNGLNLCHLNIRRIAKK